MSNKTMIKQLEFMKGKTYQYGSRIHYIIDYSIDEASEKATVKTNLESFTRPYDSLEEFLKHWTLAMQVTNITQPEENNHVAVIVENENSEVNAMIAILKDNISKVQSNKEYIPQAQSINNNINSIINLTKLKLDFYKQFKVKK